MWKRALLVVFILFCIELGLFLMALPWSELWERNLLFSFFPGLRPVFLNHYVRGALSGLGLLNVWVGLSEVWHFRQSLALLEKAESGQVQGRALDTESASLPPANTRGR